MKKVYPTPELVSIDRKPSFGSTDRQLIDPNSLFRSRQQILHGDTRCGCRQRSDRFIFVEELMGSVGSARLRFAEDMELAVVDVEYPVVGNVGRGVEFSLAASVDGEGLM